MDVLSYLAGGIGQLLLWLAVGLHLINSNREGRFIVSPGMVAIGIIGASLVMVYAILRQDWVILAGQPVAIIVGVRLLAMGQATGPSPRHEPPLKPRLPVVAPDSAEIKISSIRDAEARGVK